VSQSVLRSAIFIKFEFGQTIRCSRTSLRCTKVASTGHSSARISLPVQTTAAVRPVSWKTEVILHFDQLSAILV